MKGVEKQCQVETEQVRWARDQKQERPWVTALAVKALETRQEFLQVQAGALAMEPGQVWAEARVVGQTGVSGAGGCPVSEKVEGLLPRGKYPGYYYPSPSQARAESEIDFLEKRIRSLKQELETLAVSLKGLQIRGSDEKE